MYDHLGWVYPTAIHYGRLKIEGGVLSKSKIIQGITNGLYTGFDDPRLATFQALRKRGILPKTIRTIIYEVGIRPIDATISWATLYSINKKIIDKSSPRYFVVINPIVLSVKGLAGRKEIALKKHPEVESMGYRKIVLNPAEDGILKVYIKKDDLKKIQTHSLFRLMGFANVYDLKTLGDHLDGVIHSYGMDTARRVNAPLIHWVPVDSNVRVRLIDQNGQVLEGFGEKGLFDEPVNTIVQLEREGFARIDSKEKSVVTLYFSSK
jgi:glutamyl-tRNA synthetase